HVAPGQRRFTPPLCQRGPLSTRRFGQAGRRMAPIVPRQAPRLSAGIDKPESETSVKPPDALGYQVWCSRTGREREGGDGGVRGGLLRLRRPNPYGATGGDPRALLSEVRDRPGLGDVETSHGRPGAAAAAAFNRAAQTREANRRGGRPRHPDA